MSQKTACEIIKSRTDESCPFRLWNHQISERCIMSVFPCRFSLWNHRISDRLITSVFTCPFSLRNHHISDRWIMSVFQCSFSLWNHQISDTWIMSFFPMSVQLLKSSYLRQMNHVRSAMEIVQSHTDESCPLRLWNHQISDRWIMSVFPMSVQLVKSSNLKQMNHVRFHMSVQLVKSSNLRQMDHVRSAC